jgi:hypothetical protein
MSEKDEKKSSVIDPKDGVLTNIAKTALIGNPVFAAVDAVNNSDFFKSGKATEVKAELAAGLEKVAKAGGFGVIGYVATESDFFKSGKAAIAGEAIVGAVKNLPKTIGTASSEVLYALGSADAKITEAIGAGAGNDLTLKMCGVVEDVPVLRELSAPGCKGFKDGITESRGKK